MVPLRIAWLAPEREGRREVRPSDLLTLADPRDPDRLRERYLYWRTPERCRIVLGQSAPVSAVRRRWRRAAGADSGNTQSFPDYVARQAALTLERAERHIRGARYKVPSLVREDILATPAFQGELHHLARELGRTDARVLVEATADLREIAAGHTPLAIDVAVTLAEMALEASDPIEAAMHVLAGYNAVEALREEELALLLTGQAAVERYRERIETEDLKACAHVEGFEA